MAISPSVKSAWQVNSRVDDALLEHLTPEMLHAETPGGGYSVAQHLAHLTGSLNYWASHLDDEKLDSVDNLYQLDDEDEDVFIAETDLHRIRDVMLMTRKVALDVAEAAPDNSKGTLPHTSTDAFLIHMMVHAAHHRGQIMLALKESGYPLPDVEPIWGPWRGG